MDIRGVIAVSQGVDCRELSYLLCDNCLLGMPSDYRYVGYVHYTCRVVWDRHTNYTYVHSERVRLCKEYIDSLSEGDLMNALL